MMSTEGATTDWEATKGLLPAFVKDLRPKDLEGLKRALGVGTGETTEAVLEALLALSTEVDAKVNRGEGGGLLAQVLAMNVTGARVSTGTTKGLVVAKTAANVIRVVEMLGEQTAQGGAAEEEVGREGAAAQEPEEQADGAPARNGERRPENAAGGDRMQKLEQAVTGLQGMLEDLVKAVKEQPRGGDPISPFRLEKCAADSKVTPGAVGLEQSKVGAKVAEEVARMQQELCLYRLCDEQGFTYGDPEKELQQTFLELKQSRRVEEWSSEYKRRMEEFIRNKAPSAKPKSITEIKVAYEGLFGRGRGILHKPPIDQAALELLVGNYYAAGAGLKFGSAVGAAFRTEMEGATGILDGEEATAFIKDVQKRNKALEAITKVDDKLRRTTQTPPSGNGGGKPTKG